MQDVLVDTAVGSHIRLSNELHDNKAIKKLERARDPNMQSPEQSMHYFCDQRSLITSRNTESPQSADDMSQDRVQRPHAVCLINEGGRPHDARSGCKQPR